MRTLVALFVVAPLIMTACAKTSVTKTNLSFPDKPFEAVYEATRVTIPPARDDKTERIEIRGDGKGRIRFDSDKTKEGWYHVDDLDAGATLYYDDQNKVVQSFPHDKVPPDISNYFEPLFPQFNKDQPINGNRIINGRTCHGYNRNTRRAVFTSWFDEHSKFLVESTARYTFPENKGSCLAGLKLKSLKFIGVNSTPP